MASFSERVGAVAPRTALQIDSMSDALRNSLWNVVLSLYGDEYESWTSAAARIARDVRKVPVDELSPNLDLCRKWIKKYFIGASWFEALDVVEYLVSNHYQITTRTTNYGRTTTPHRFSPSQVAEIFNRVLESELSGYRFVQGVLTPITSPIELSAINEAVAAANSKGLRGAATHIQAAISAMGQKPAPNFRNAVAESIHAVESVAKQISGDDARTLDPALKKLASTAGIHAALQGAFSKMYGWTSDADGIRHAILDEPNVGFAEAKYMVVSCSAFVHYLIQKADAAGMLMKR